jgi:hypothetical protein
VNSVCIFVVICWSRAHMRGLSTGTDQSQHELHVTRSAYIAHQHFFLSPNLTQCLSVAHSGGEAVDVAAIVVAAVEGEAELRAERRRPRRSDPRRRTFSTSASTWTSRSPSSSAVAAKVSRLGMSVAG